MQRSKAAKNMQQQPQPQPQPVSKPTTPFKFRLTRRKTPVFSTGKPLATRGLEAPKSSADPAFDPDRRSPGLAGLRWAGCWKLAMRWEIWWSDVNSVIFDFEKLQKHGTEHCFDFLVPRQLRQEVRQLRSELEKCATNHKGSESEGDLGL